MFSLRSAVSSILRSAPSSSSLSSLCRLSFSSSSPSLSLFSHRSFHSSSPRYGLEEFFLNQRPQAHGRAWTAAELRNKSNTELQGLWFICLKEKNMLLTYRWEARRQATDMLMPERYNNVKLTMNRIKKVLHERWQEYKLATDAAYRASHDKRVADRGERRREEDRIKALPKPKPQFIRQKHPLRKKYTFADIVPTEKQQQRKKAEEERQKKQQEEAAAAAASASTTSTESSATATA